MTTTVPDGPEPDPGHVTIMIRGSREDVAFIARVLAGEEQGRPATPRRRPAHLRPVDDTDGPTALIAGGEQQR